MKSDPICDTMNFSIYTLNLHYARHLLREESSEVFKVLLVYLNKHRGLRKLTVFGKIFQDLPKLRKYLHELKQFQSSGGRVDEWAIYLNEDTEFAGSVSGHYFWQDILVAQWVLAQKKKFVADLGSRLDGYVAHVAASQRIFVIDIRPIQKTIPNIEFVREDILNYKSNHKFEIVTSLHTIEHIGLGRYGDPIEPDGHIKAFSALSQMTLPKGYLVVSFPIDLETRIEFNGQRRIGVKEPLKWADSNKLKFINFMGLLHNDEIVSFDTSHSLASFIPESGALGIYFFKKMA